MPGALNPFDFFTKEDKDVAHYESIRDLMVIPRELFGLPSNSHLSNNSHIWGVLEQRLSDRNYEKMTKLTKTNELTNMTKNDNFQGSPKDYGDEDDKHLTQSLKIRILWLWPMNRN